MFERQLAESTKTAVDETAPLRQPDGAPFPIARRNRGHSACLNPIRSAAEDRHPFRAVSLFTLVILTAEQRDGILAFVLRTTLAVSGNVNLTIKVSSPSAGEANQAGRRDGAANNRNATARGVSSDLSGSRVHVGVAWCWTGRVGAV